MEAKYRFNAESGEFYVFDEDKDSFVYTHNFAGMAEKEAIARYEQLKEINGE